MDFILTELKILRGALLRVAGCFLLLLIIFFSVPIGGATVATQAILRVRSDLLPKGVTLVVSNPLDAFIAETVLAAELALLLTVPVAAIEIYRFVAPGLYPRERRMLAWFFISSFLLMLGGGVFAYKFILPAFFSGLFGFMPEGVSPLFNLREVMGLVGGMLLTTAVLFLLPVCMSLLSWMGLVQSVFWTRYWRQAVLIALVFSAIITPDGTGVTMMLLALPICGLYALGIFGARVLSQKGRKATYSSTELI